MATNIPTKSTGKSQELKMTVHGVYYVKKVTPTHLRVIGLFTGEERNSYTTVLVLWLLRLTLGRTNGPRGGQGGQIGPGEDVLPRGGHL